MDARETLERLRAALRPLMAGGIALAYSGGVDSALLLAVLEGLRRETPFPLLTLTMRSVFAPWGADAGGVPQDIVEVDALAVPGLRDNPPDRCYRCKHDLFGRFAALARGRGLATLMDGTNADDLLEDRPGLRALREWGVRSPLAELGIPKAAVRAMAAALGLPCADTPSAPCLATRFPYGTALTEKALQTAEAGEAFLRGLLPRATPFRLRIQGDAARIEVPPACFGSVLAQRASILAHLATLGLRTVSLDLAGR